MKIGICDDMPKYLFQIRSLCECYFEKNCIEYEFLEFLSGEEVLEYKGNIDILFLDIEMNNGIDGIETMEKLLKQNNVWKIVFVTSHDEKFKQTYGLKTLGFISKHVDYLSVEKWLQIAVKELKEDKIFVLKNKNNLIKVRISDIIFMKSEKNNTYIFTENTKKLSVGNLKNWETRISNTSLIRIHKSYIVNMDYVIKRAFDYVIMEGYNEEIPIGRVYRSGFKEQYIHYVDNKINNRI